MMERDSKIYVAGHRGMVGSSIVRRLEQLGHTNIVKRSSKELDLRNQQAVKDFMASEKPEYVFLAAAKVGGIQANNTYRAEFLYDNLMMEANVIDAAYQNGVKKLLFLGSSCIYPKFADQPLKEDSLLSGYLEPTNEPYAIAKIAGIKLCETYREQYGADFISAMPTNLYGPGDNYDLENSHVLPAMIRKFHEAKLNGHATVTLWGDGSPMREFLHTDDLADALVFLMDAYSEKQFMNIGYGSDITIKHLAELIQKIVGHEGEIIWDTSKPNGTPRKLMDSSRIKELGWEPKIELEEGINGVYQAYSGLKIF
jgi:GDP-L-fucose synthase